VQTILSILRGDGRRDGVEQMAFPGGPGRGRACGAEKVGEFVRCLRSAEVHLGDGGEIRAPLFPGGRKEVGLSGCTRRGGGEGAYTRSRGDARSVKVVESMTDGQNI